jgi:hypothetical protein
VLDQLVASGDVRTHPGAHRPDLVAFEREAGLRLPDAHRRLLLRTNGFEAFRGYLRLFGVGPAAIIDIQRWNEPGLWKFAYRGLADGFLCFAELGEGHQFAYGPDGDICNLLVNDMRVVYRYPDFEAFMASPVLHGVLYQDGAYVEWMSRLGDLAPEEHVADPGFGLIEGGPVRRHVKVDAVESMVFYGDAWFAEAPKGAVATGLEFDVDAVGRRRLRAVPMRPTLDPEA